MRRIILIFLVPLVALAMMLSGCNFSSGSKRAKAGGIYTIASRDDLLDADNITLGGTANDRTIMGSTVYDALFTTDGTAMRRRRLPRVDLRESGRQDLDA